MANSFVQYLIEGLMNKSISMEDIKKYTVKTNSLNEEYKCDYCEKKFHRQQDKSSHITKMHKISKYGPLWTDESIKNEKKVFICDECDQQRQSENSLIFHKKISHGQNHLKRSISKVKAPTNKCAMCDESSTGKNYVDDHVKVHKSNIKPHYCQS